MDAPIRIAAEVEGLENRHDDDEFLSTRARQFLLSASLIRDACVSRLEIEYKRDLISVKRYENFYSKWAQNIYHILTIINLSTIIIEYPSTIIYNKNQQPAYQIPLAINIVCEAYFYYRWYQIHCMMIKGKFWSNMSSKITLIILLLMSTDAVIFVICQHVESGIPIRWSRFLRPILMLTFPENRRLRAAFINLRYTAEDVLPVFLLLLATISLVSVVAMTVITEHKFLYPDGTPYFSSFMEVFWEFYVLTTGANSPDVLIPAYEGHRIYIVFYVFISVFCNWLFMGILTASVYNSYKSHLGHTVVETVAKRKRRLDEAFKLIATEASNDARGISHGTFMRLMRASKPGRTEDALSVIFHILDKSRTGHLNANEFSRLAEYIRVKMIEVDVSREHFSKFLPKFYHIFMTPGFQMFRNVVLHPVTRGFFVSCVFANGLTAVLLRTYSSIQEVMEWFFTFLFLFELIINYLASGGVSFFSDRWNRFDFVIVFGAFFGQILQVSLSVMGISMPAGVTQMILTVRLLRLLKVLKVVPSFRVVIDCVLAILPSLGAYAMIMLLLFYIYACFGMELFSYAYLVPMEKNYTAATTCSSPRLIGTNFVKWHYCLFSFNSIGESYLLLFAATVGNNWQILIDGMAFASTQWARVYFMFIHWTCVLLVLNVVLAFIIEAFLIEFDSQTTKFETYVRERLEELGMDAKTELKRRGLSGYGAPGFLLTMEQLDKSFPPNSPSTKAFALAEDTVSIEVLMFRMFEREVEEMLTSQRFSN